MATRRTRLTILLVGAAIAAVLIGGGGYFVYWRYFSETHALAKRQEARKRWLEIAAEGRARKSTLEDAHVLLQCFKKGEAISDVAAILATGIKRGDLPDVDGRISYDWVFVVPKPPAPDATGYIVTVYVDTKKEPPIIDAVYGSYTMD